MQAHRTFMGRWHRALGSHPRLWSAVLAGVAVALWVPAAWAGHLATRVLLGWNVGALCYLGLALQLIWRSSDAQMQRRALREDDGRWFVLGLAALAALAVLVAVASQLTTAKGMPDPQRAAHLALAAVTVVLAWGFIQTVFALHYAHDFYLARSRGLPGGLLFPGTEAPGYVDFLYFSCVIGTSAQTADVSLASRAMRALGLLHGVLAFFFNTTVLALAINIAASLF